MGSGGPARGRHDGGGERGSAVVEFALVSVIALTLTLAVAQLALFLYERNVLLGSLSEGVRVAAAQGHTLTEGRQRAVTLVRVAVGSRVAAAVRIAGAAQGGRVVLEASGGLPSLVPGIPTLPVHLTASMHKEEQLVAGQPGGAG